MIPSVGVASPAISRAEWLAAHEFLLPVSGFDEAVSRALSAGPAAAELAEPNWEAYRADFHAGVPLLSSHAARLQIVPAVSAALADLAHRLSADQSIPAKIRADCGLLAGRWIANPALLERTARWILSGEKDAPPQQAGLLRLLGWKAASHALAKLLARYREWRDDERWAQPHCPACGALPVMSWLVPGEGVRERQLSCGCCGTAWAAQRIGCSYCGNDDSDRLAILETEGEAGLRLDLCEQCKGYMKTVAGDGDPALFLSDWTSLHLDLLARERGYQRKGVSLYEP